MGAIEEHAKHKVRTEGCLICAARKDWGEPDVTGPATAATTRKAAKVAATKIRAAKVPPVEVTEEAGQVPLATFAERMKAARAAKKAAGSPPVELITTAGTEPEAVIVTPTETVVEPELVTITGVRDDDLTREGWLLQAVEKMRPDFVAAGREVPEVRISIGWPGGRSARLDPLGQCWHPSTVGDGIPAIFITPSQDDPVQVLATTRHEMVHAAGEMNHRAGFRKLAAQVGFDPQPGATGVSSTYRTPALEEKLQALYAELGPFPHSPVNKGATNAGKPTTQSTRMLKVHCEEVGFDDDNEPQVCGYTVRTTAKWLAVAIPSCPVHGTEMTVEVK